MWPRVLFSLALFGLLIGMMIGRITAPEPSRLEQIEVLPGSLVLWFDNPAELHGEVVEGTVAIAFKAAGRPANGRLLLGERPVAWRVQESREGLALTLVAARPLQGDWKGTAVDGRWRLVVNLREE